MSRTLRPIWLNIRLAGGLAVTSISIVEQSRAFTAFAGGTITRPPMPDRCQAARRDARGVSRQPKSYHDPQGGLREDGRDEPLHPACRERGPLRRARRRLSWRNLCANL